MFLLLMQTAFLLLPALQFQKMISFALRLARVALLIGTANLRHANTPIIMTVTGTSLVEVRPMVEQPSSLVQTGLPSVNQLTLVHCWVLADWKLLDQTR